MLRSALACITAFFVSFSARATGCPDHYAGGRPPTITRTSLKPRTQELCFQAFGVMHSGLSRGPLWSAEHLLRAEVEDAEQLIRKDSFHAEPRLPAADRAELADYARSGFDRGHMSPNGDMADPASQAQSFSLANIVPQQHTPNAGVWAGIEAAVRRLARQDGEVYVVTGPAFLGESIGSLKGRVLVPTHVWKVVYSPRQKAAGAHLVANRSDASTASAMSVTTLEQVVGLQLLPGVPQHVRDTSLALPMPAGQAARRRQGEPVPQAGHGLLGRAQQAIEWLLKHFR